MHMYVNDETAAEIRYNAKVRGLSVSRYLAELVSRELGSQWPEGYFEEVIGSWQGDVPLERPPRLEPEERESF